MLRIFLFFVTPFFVLLVYNAATMYFHGFVSQNVRWTEEPVLKHLIAPSQVDIVFVGSSRTQNHINSHQLEMMLGRKIFNYGIIGRRWQNYPFIVKKAGELNPKNIVISIPAQSLTSSVPCSELPFSFSETIFYFAHDNIGCIKAIDKSKVLDALPMNRFDKYLKFDVTSKRHIRLLKSKYGYSIDSDPREVNHIRGNNNRLVVTYKNGDGQVFSKSSTAGYGERENVNIDYVQLNPEAIKYMSDLSIQICKIGAKPIFIIEASLDSTRFTFHPKVFAELKSTLGCNGEVISIDSEHITRDMWADRGHLNLEGTETYTRLLAKKLSEII